MKKLRIVLEVEVPEPPQGFAEQALDSYLYEIDELLHPSGFCPIPTPLVSNQPWAISATFVPQGVFA